MTHLADVNVLIALAWPQHPHHARAVRWLSGLAKNEALATSPLTELGFVRVSMQLPGLNVGLAVAQAALAQIRTARRHAFLADDLPAARMPVWVRTAAHTTDGHLAELALAHGAMLVTFDRGIPGAAQIP